MCFCAGGGGGGGFRQAEPEEWERRKSMHATCTCMQGQRLMCTMEHNDSVTQTDWYSPKAEQVGRGGSYLSSELEEHEFLCPIQCA